ncbi:hypothetical protein E2C01_054303 [Portunus trituberculatus]|uniref:Uncharacterized protein n=1 Tax=Portunus trituberculatus TaxID=210409 RepID=A0A5B7GUM4_PORTR|nr:hypothetical protein [Portunus trituberculatus]
MSLANGVLLVPFPSLQTPDRVSPQPPDPHTRSYSLSGSGRRWRGCGVGTDSTNDTGRDGTVLVRRAGHCASPSPLSSRLLPPQCSVTLTHPRGAVGCGGVSAGRGGATRVSPFCVTRDTGDKWRLFDCRWDFFGELLGWRELPRARVEWGLGVKAPPVSQPFPPRRPSLTTNGTQHATSRLLIVRPSRLCGGPFIAPPRPAPLRPVPPRPRPQLRRPAVRKMDGARYSSGREESVSPLPSSPHEPSLAPRNFPQLLASPRRPDNCHSPR